MYFRTREFVGRVVHAEPQALGWSLLNRGWHYFGNADYRNTIDKEVTPEAR